MKIDELRKGVLHEDTPNYDEEYGTITYKDDSEGVTSIHNGALFELVSQEEA